MSYEMQTKAYAKINLTLDVLSKKDGFHEINSVITNISLYDELSFEEIGNSGDIILKRGLDGKRGLDDKRGLGDEYVSGFRRDRRKFLFITSGDNQPDTYDDDIILKTAFKLKKLFKVKQGVKISVKKNIPISAGLGGGSADAAASLLVLNQLWNLNLNKEDLMKIGFELGSDVPFFIAGNPCFVSGKGEIIEDIELPEMDILFVNPGYGISTEWAYKEMDKLSYERKFSSLRMRNLIENREKCSRLSSKLSKGELKREIAASLYNDFIHIQRDDVKEIIKRLIANGALNASITGKGPTVFGVFNERKRALEAYNALKDKHSFVYLAKSINQVKNPQLALVPLIRPLRLQTLSASALLSTPNRFLGDKALNDLQPLPDSQLLTPN